MAKLSVSVGIMIVARWSITAKFGKSGEVASLLKEWSQEFGKQVGFGDINEILMIGSIGTTESKIVNEVQFRTLADLDRAFTQLSTLEGHAAWGKKMSPLVVSGTNHWEVYRIL